MTSLRDPRFEKALEVAPDAHLRPDARTRRAVLQSAAAAVQAPPARERVGWWRQWWSGRRGESREGRMPWNAAFATVLLAGFVTLLWHDQPVPDAQLDDAPAKAVRRAEPSAASSGEVPATGSGVQPPPVLESAPATAPPAPSAAPGQAAQDAAMAEVSPRATREKRAPVAAQEQERAREATEGTAANAAPAGETRGLQPPPAAAPLPAPPPAPAPAPVPAPAPAPALPAEPAPSAAAPAPRADAAAGAAESSTRAQAAAAAPAPSRAALPALPAGNAFGRAAPVAAPDSAALQGWTELRITQGNQTQRVARADAAGLAAQVRRLAPGSGEGALPGTASLRIAFMRGDEVLAELELGEEPWVRWTLLRAGFAGQWTAQADRGQLQTLRIELQRLGTGARPMPR